MTSTVLLRLAGPLQSWGSGSRYETRETDDRPTKSGVLGLVAAALGRERDFDNRDLTGLRFAVRVDAAGELIRDFHTMTTKKQQTSLSYRYYLADAVFVVALEGDDELITRIDAALTRPRWRLSLGRTNCAPQGRLNLGVRSTDAITALSDEPWHIPQHMQKRPAAEPFIRLPLYRDAISSSETGDLVNDVPISYASSHRKYGARMVVRESDIRIPNAAHVPAATETTTEHDPFDLVA